MYSTNIMNKYFLGGCGSAKGEYCVGGGERCPVENGPYGPCREGATCPDDEYCCCNNHHQLERNYYDGGNDDRVGTYSLRNMR